jgi:hypothetical protein
VTPDEHSESTEAQVASRLEVSVGHEAFEPGRTQVQLDPSGRVEVVSCLEGSEPQRAEAKLDAERAAEMIRTAERHLSIRESSRPGLPDEPRYRFEIGDGERRESFELWRSDLGEHPQLQQLVAALQDVLEEQTRGEIIL